MFNIGLMYEKGEIPDSSYQRAETWFRRSAENGYAAAYFHLAQRMLERGGADDEALEQIRIAAQQG